MLRTQISLTPEQMERARSEAARRGTSLAALVREALDRHLNETSEAQVREVARAAVGGFRSGHHSTSARHDDALAGEERW